MLSIDCLQKCDTGGALLSTCWRRYKPPSPFITLLNFMVFTILSAPCYLSKDFWFLMSWSVVFHSLLPCGFVCVDLRAWICECVTPWCQLKPSSTSSRPPANFHTYLSFWAFEPICGNEDLWIRGTWESSWNHLLLSSSHLPHPTIACWSSVSMLLPPFLLICVSKSVASWTHLPSSTWPPASP